jgi:hypothetical protein
MINKINNSVSSLVDDQLALSQNATKEVDTQGLLEGVVGKLCGLNIVRATGLCEKPAAVTKPAAAAKVQPNTIGKPKEYSFNTTFPGRNESEFGKVKVFVSESTAQSGPRNGKTKATVRIENADDSRVKYTADQLKRMTEVVTNIIEVSRDKGLEPAIALAMAADESRWGSGVKTSAQDPYTNPLQVTSGSGLNPVGKNVPNAQRTNVEKGIDYIIKLSKGSSLDSRKGLEKMIAAYRIGPTKIGREGLETVLKKSPEVATDLKERLQYIEEIGQGTKYRLPQN